MQVRSIMAEGSLQDEDRACDFLHVGSGWSKSDPPKTSGYMSLFCDEEQQKKDQRTPKLSSTLATFLVPPRSVGIDASKLAVRNSQGRGWVYSYGPGRPGLGLPGNAGDIYVYIRCWIYNIIISVHGVVGGRVTVTAFQTARGLRGCPDRPGWA